MFRLSEVWKYIFLYYIFLTKDTLKKNNRRFSDSQDAGFMQAWWLNYSYTLFLDVIK